MRRTLIPLTALALAAGCAPAAMAPQPPQAPPASSSAATPASAEPAETPVEPAGPACLAEAEALPLETRVGQLFMMGVDTAGLTETARQAIASGRIGSVVLLGNSTAGSMEIRQLTAQLGSLGTADLPLLVAVDQEGGNVQRLRKIPGGQGSGTLPPVGTTIHQVVGASAGDTDFFQVWYRDPHGACGNAFNTTNGVIVVWGI